MSHLTTFKNNSLINTNKERLADSLKEIGLELDFNHKNIRNTWINETVDASIKKDGNYIAVGLNFITNAEGKEEVVVAGDFWGTGLNQEELTNRIAQVYQKNDIIAKCRSQRWYVNDADVKVNENGEYVITASRYA